jgi:hypothetical protein
MFYGYCSETKRMRMMDYPEYVRNVRRAYSDLYEAMYRNAQGSMRSWWESVHGGAAHGGYGHHWGCGHCGCGHPYHRTHHHPRSEHCDCGCHAHHGNDCHGYDCHCSCCICDADAVEYAHCGERRLIPLLFENDTRRERDVKLELGSFKTSGGRELGWQAAFSETEFKLPPCGGRTVTLAVVVDCGKLVGESAPSPAPTPNQPPATTPEPGRINGGDVNQRIQSVDECKVGYATVRAEGCLVRPLVVAVAVLPNDCGAHHAGCGCGCCN